VSRRSCGTLVGAGGLAALVYLGWQVVTWPDVAALARENPRTTAFIERQRSGGAVEVAWRWVPYEAISPHLKRAVVVAEDIEFFHHRGFAGAEIENALRQAWEEKELPRGASTISQQVAKNLWLSGSRNPLRKVKEAILTRELERALPKRRILEIYLNVAEFGPRVFGAEAAAQRYFGKPAAALDERQAALFAASLPRPSHWHPGSPSRAYARHAERIRRRMAKATWLWKLI
jgi:monofunctional biosynthetic peptidoglycan transglycosylase